MILGPRRRGLPSSDDSDLPELADAEPLRILEFLPVPGVRKWAPLAEAVGGVLPV
jgi:hypothetical protein